MTEEEFAEILNGSEYLKEMSLQEKKEAEASGLLVIYGASDDITIFSGTINDERGAWDGATHILFENGDFFDRDELHEQMVNKGYIAPKTAMQIVAEWCPDYFECSWMITPNVPHAKFYIMEDGEVYCVGAVVKFSPNERED